MNTFDYMDSMFRVFVHDEELTRALGMKKGSQETVDKLRREDVLPEEYDAKKLPFIAFYFADAFTSASDFMNNGNLKIDIYSRERRSAGTIRKRIVQLMHMFFDERVRAEGQYASGIPHVYKYRLEFSPIVLT
jgi:hypothetical protein